MVLVTLFNYPKIAINLISSKLEWVKNNALFTQWSIYSNENDNVSKT